MTNLKKQSFTYDENHFANVEIRFSCDLDEINDTFKTVSDVKKHLISVGYFESCIYLSIETINKLFKI